jgi:hypothetical protein
MAAGNINHAAISYMSRGAAAELHAQLITDTVGTNSILLYRMQRWTAKALAQVDKIIRHKSAIFGRWR